MAPLAKPKPISRQTNQPLGLVFSLQNWKLQPIQIQKPYNVLGGFVCLFVFCFFVCFSQRRLKYLQQYLKAYYETIQGPRWLSNRESACNAGDTGSIPEWGKSPGGEHGNSLQYSCLGNYMDRGAWWATVHGISKSQT